MKLILNVINVLRDVRDQRISDFFKNKFIVKVLWMSLSYEIYGNDILIHHGIKHLSQLLPYFSDLSLLCNIPKHICVYGMWRTGLLFPMGKCIEMKNFRQNLLNVNNFNLNQWQLECFITQLDPLTIT